MPLSLRLSRLRTCVLLGLLVAAAALPVRAQSVLDQARNEPVPEAQPTPASGPVARQTEAPANVFGGPGGVMANTGRRVNDFADLLSLQEQADLERKLYALEDSTGTQIIVLTLATLGGQMDPAQYATEIGYRWRVGQADADNGAVILVVKDDRQMFIATGKGLEGSVPDAVASRIVRNVMAPAFREGRFYDGLSQAVDVIVLATRGEFTAPPEASGGDDSGVLGFCLLAILLFVVVMVLSSRGKGGKGGRRYRSGFGGPPVVIWGGGGWGGGGGGGGGGIDFGGFSGGGGDFGGGGAGGSW